MDTAYHSPENLETCYYFCMPMTQIPVDFRLAVKGCVVQKGELLLIQRRSTDPHKPGQWDIPGGRLEWGEDPYEGLRRETREEVSLEIDIGVPVDVQHFTRDDGQKITMLIFLCTPRNLEVRLSAEHTAFRWVPLAASAEEFPDWIQPILKRIH